MSPRTLIPALVLGLSAAAVAQPDPSGIEFVTIGAPGNAAWAGNGEPGDLAIGRGSVGYEYKIGKFEVTTAQWVEFFNAAYDRPQTDWLPHLLPPTFWGAVSATPNTPGGRRWSVPAGNEMRPTGDISWRMAAMYTNWLHNDKSTAREAFLDGAYDVSTFGYQGASGIFTDQLTHHPGARYWIPTWDEWLKAAHYDPDKPNPGGDPGGWWLFPNGSDSAPRYGPPGVRVTPTGPPLPDPNGVLAQANAVWTASQYPGYNPFAVPLGAYPDIQSPWGLLDVAGATNEWTEYVFLTNGIWPTARGNDGSHWTTNGLGDQVFALGGDFPSTATYDHGFRIASAVPAPSTCVPLLLAAILCPLRRRSTGGRPCSGISPP